MWIETEGGRLINLDKVECIYVDVDRCAIVANYGANEDEDYIGVYKDTKTAKDRFSQLKRYMEKYAEVTLLRVSNERK